MVDVGKRTKETTEGNIQNIHQKIGGEFKINPSPDYVNHRVQMFDTLLKQQQENLKSLPRDEITITLKDGKQIKGIRHETTPGDIAKKISKKLYENTMVAEIVYTQKLDDGFIDPCDEDELINPHEEAQKPQSHDLHRPLEGDCTLELINFEDPRGKMAFWHSSAHILGQALEMKYGCHLCIGPPLNNGFYYDCFIGDQKVTPEQYEDIQKFVEKYVKENQAFERVVLTKDQALELFKHNPFKVQLISKKIPNDAKTIAYRCGNLIDLCTGPHLPSSNKIKAFKVVKSSSAYWLGHKDNDDLQRIYGVAFPTDKELKEYVRIQEEIAKRDHRKIGVDQMLFQFNPMSAGSAFFFSNGANLYNKLLQVMRDEYRIRGYKEVISPNIYNSDLWQKSGHWDKYQQNMFIIQKSPEHEAVYGVKPMNCPGHCLMFGMHLVSYRELPLRFADFGVLHRNELHGALSGLTRVRRFQQDDAHIFCSQDQIQEEIMGVLDFIGHIYDIFGFEWKIELSTRPENSIGDLSLWENAEYQLKQALDKLGRPWVINPGDGAYYGPKIDIKLFDAMKRQHQCGTIQLDFNLPIRFDLQYRANSDEQFDVPNKPGFQRPVIIHRAIYGSLERFIAILCEHTAGKWPFFINPRQIIVIPISQNFEEYAKQVHKRLLLEGFNAEVDLIEGTINKKVRKAQLEQISYMAIVGKVEQEAGMVDLRDRDQKDTIGKMTIEQLIRFLKDLSPKTSQIRQKMIGDAYYAKTEEFDKLEKELTENMFLGGFSVSDKDRETFQNLKKFDAQVYPSIQRWSNFMKNQQQ